MAYLGTKFSFTPMATGPSNVKLLKRENVLLRCMVDHLDGVHSHSVGPPRLARPRCANSVRFVTGCKTFAKVLCILFCATQWISH